VVDGEWWQRKKVRRRLELSGVVEVQLLVFGELHGYLGKLLGVKVEAEGVLTKLSTAAQCQWRTTTRIGGDSATGNKGKQVRSVGHPQELLGEEVEDGGLTGDIRIWPEATGTLFTQNGEKWEIGELVELVREKQTESKEECGRSHFGHQRGG
jgi:hypothetical protein